MFYPVLLCLHYKYDMQVVACKENLIYIIYMLLSALACDNMYLYYI